MRRMRHFIASHAAILMAIAAGIRPAAAQLAVTTNAAHERAARPSERYQGTIEILNTTSTPQEARLYQTDYRTWADGRSEFGPPARSRRSNARWITFAPARLIVPPHGRAVATYTVTVPSTPSLSGSYWSIIMVEGLSSTALESSSPSAQRVQVGIEPRIRFGVQVATHVGGEASVRIAFDSVRAVVDSGQHVLQYDFVNTGDRAVRLLMSVELFTLDGRPLRKLEQQRGLLYPETSARQLFRFGTLPAGEYRALVTADAGGDEVFGAQYTIRFR